MRIVIVSIGTHGDVQPFFALAKGLICSSHDVIVAAPANYKEYAKSYNIPFFPLRCDYYSLIHSDLGKRVLLENAAPTSAVLKQSVMPIIFRVLQDIWTISRWADAIIYYRLVLRAIGKADIPAKPSLVVTHTIPVEVSENNEIVTSVDMSIIKKLSLNPAGAPIICGYSPHVFPVPKDDVLSFHATGFWFLDHPDKWHPSKGLLKF